MKIKLTLIALAALLFAACEKEKPPVFNPEVSTAVNSAAIDVELLHHIWLYTDGICTEYSTGNLFCWSDVNDSVNGNSVLLDYNFDIQQIYGCGFFDTTYTGGRMIIRYTAPYSTADTVWVELINLHTMGNTYNGTLLIDRSVASQPRVIIQNLNASRNGMTYSTSGSIVVEILSARQEVSGSLAASGDQTYTLNIQAPLVLSLPISQTKHFNTGKAVFTHPLQEGAINYGNGAEDRLATFSTPDGLRYVLTLQDF